MCGFHDGPPPSMERIELLNFLVTEAEEEEEAKEEEEKEEEEEEEKEKEKNISAGGVLEDPPPSLEYTCGGNITIV